MDMDIYRRIGLACSRIPRGRVATYGQIAPALREAGELQTGGIRFEKKGWQERTCRPTGW